MTVSDWTRMGIPSIHEDDLPRITSRVDQKLFADTIHTLKNGLGGIAGFAALLDRDLDTDDPKKRLVQRIQDGVIRINDLVIGLMMLVRDHRPSREKILLRSLIRDVWENYWHIRQKDPPDILSQSEFKRSHVELFADLRLVEQMVFHAIRFVDLVGKRFRSILIMYHPEDRVNLQFGFTNGRLPSEFPGGVATLIDSCEPVEARLSLAIVARVAGMYDGTVTVTSFSEQQKVLTLELLKGMQTDDSG